MSKSLFILQTVQKFDKFAEDVLNKLDIALCETVLHNGYNQSQLELVLDLHVHNCHWIAEVNYT